MIRTTTSFVAGAIVALVLGTGTAYAATGGKFIIGRSNAATTTTTLSNSGGTALQLNSKAGQPSLRVNRNTKVPNLNADLLDGVDASGLARVTSLGSLADSGYVDDNQTPGDTTDDSVVAVAVCPPGSQVTGGGGTDLTSDGVILHSGPDGGNSWVVVSTTATTTPANAANVVAYARCYNPLGNVAGNARVAPAKHVLSAQTRAVIRKAGAQH